MDDLDKERLLNVCQALGGFEETTVLGDGSIIHYDLPTYVPGDEVLGCLTDLKGMLRKDIATPERHVYLKLGEWGVLKRNLLPTLLGTDFENERSKKIAMAVVELIVPMTWPLAEDAESVPNHLETLSSYKECFLNKDIFTCIMKLLVPTLAIPYRDRSSRDNAKIRLIISLFRNLLAIPDKSCLSKASTEAYLRSTLQEELIVCMEESNVYELIMTFGACMKEREFSEWNLLVLEIIHLTFRGRDPLDLLPKENENNDLKMLVETEKKRKPVPVSTRHSRFGGSVSIKTLEGKTMIVSARQAISSNVNVAVDNKKKEKVPIKKKNLEKNVVTITRKIENKHAVAVMRKIANSFLDNNVFNALLSSVKKDFDIERDGVKDVDYVHFLSVASFFLCYLDNVKGKNIEGASNLDFDTVAEFISVRGLNFLFRHMRIFEEDKKWGELHIAITCFKNFLFILGSMMESTNDEYKEASDNIQHNLYYEEWMLNLIISFCRSPKNTSLGYLKTLIETIHILMKMLSYYSKSKPFMLIKKKGRKSKKVKTVTKKSTGEADEENVVEDIVESETEEQTQKKAKELTQEREFRLEKIEMDFAYYSIVSTYIELLRYYEDQEVLPPKYVHYITKMMHRIFVKCKMEAFFFQLSIFELFNTIICDRKKLQSIPEYAELYNFIKFVLKKFVAYTKENPFLYVEILFPKSRGDCRRLQNQDDLDVKKQQREGDDESEDDAKHNQILQSDEIEILPSLTWSQQLGVAVALLMKEKKLALLEWMQLIMTKTALARMEQDADAYDPVELADLADTDEIKTDLTSNSRFHILLRLLKIKRSFEATDWFIDSFYTPDDLMIHCKLIHEFIESPLDMDGKPLHKLVRRKKSATRKKRERKENPEDEDEDDGKKKKMKEMKAFLSAQFIEDSDEDDDEAFFEAERLRRLKNEEKHTEGAIPASLKSLPSSTAIADSLTNEVGMTVIEKDSNLLADYLHESDSDSDMSSDDEDVEMEKPITSRSNNRRVTALFSDSDEESDAD